MVYKKKNIHFAKWIHHTGSKYQTFSKTGNRVEFGGNAWVQLDYKDWLTIKFQVDHGSPNWLIKKEEIKKPIKAKKGKSK